MIVDKFDEINLPGKIVQPNLKPLDKYFYELIGSYMFEFNGLYKKHFCHYSISVPDGFICDGQSVPRMFWSASGMRPDGIVRAAALVHDALYRSAGGRKHPIIVRREGIRDTYIDRLASDQLYRDIYIKSAMGDQSEISRAKIGYAMLRLFGKKHYGNKSPSESG